MEELIQKQKEKYNNLLKDYLKLEMEKDGLK